MIYSTGTGRSSQFKRIVNTYRFNYNVNIQDVVDTVQYACTVYSLNSVITTVTLGYDDEKNESVWSVTDKLCVFGP